MLIFTRKLENGVKLYYNTNTGKENPIPVVKYYHSNHTIPAYAFGFIYKSWLGGQK